MEGRWTLERPFCGGKRDADVGMARVNEDKVPMSEGKEEDGGEGEEEIKESERKDVCRHFGRGAYNE